MTDRLDQHHLVEAAMKTTGLTDFGPPTWWEGLERLVDSLRHEAHLNTLGVEIARSDIIRVLTCRLQITSWRNEHPEVGRSGVDRPIIIVGQPRTGTTILYDLLAQDPRLRVPRTWEVDRPFPPPDRETYEDDPRIAEVQAGIDMVDLLIPGFRAFHPMGALLGQECMRMTAGEFRSMIFSVQYHVRSYNSWLLHEADLAPAYRWHRCYLQHLQSRFSGRWLLKAPAHLWHLDALAAEYPDALIVQTHRDPLKVITSVSTLAHHLRRMTSDETTVAQAAEQYAEDILLGIERSMDARDRKVFPDRQIIDVRFADFIADPFAVIRRVYAHMDRELTPAVESRMRDFLKAHPHDGGGKYRWSDTGLNAAELRERFREYQERFGVSTELLS